MRRCRLLPVVLLPLLPTGAAVAEEVRAVIRSPARVVISAGMPARIAELPFTEGAAFAAGDRLVAFDCMALDADSRAAQAAAAAAAIDHKQKVFLKRHGAAGAGEVELAAAEVARRDAESESMAARLAECTVAAPFAGRVVEISARAEERVEPGRPVMVIIDDTRLEVEIVAPSGWLRWLAAGAAFSLAVDETGDIVAGEIARLGAEVDPVSQTVKLYGRLLDRPSGVLAGMSGNVTFAGAPKGAF